MPLSIYSQVDVPYKSQNSNNIEVLPKPSLELMIELIYGTRNLILFLPNTPLLAINQSKPKYHLCTSHLLGKY